MTKGADNVEHVLIYTCSISLQTLFRSSFLHDKAPVIVLKDIDFENLKALVEYMYKGEANVPLHRLQSFIRTAESLQIRGLAEGATKHFDDHLASKVPSVIESSFPSHGMVASTMPQLNKISGSNEGKTSSPLAAQNGSANSTILASHLAKMREGFDFNPDVMLPRHPSHYSPAMNPTSHHPGSASLSPSKRSRKPRGNSDPHQPRNASKMITNKPRSLSQIFKNSNNNNSPTFDDPESTGGRSSSTLKIDEDDSDDTGKENRQQVKNSTPKKDSNDDLVIDLEASNNGGPRESGDEEEEEEPSVPAPHHGMPDLSAAST